jgi:ribosomal protein S18 acetylase RimI-like enzyme
MTIRKAKLNDMPNLVWLFDAYRVFYQKISDIKTAAVFLTERLENQESVIFVAENEAQELLGFVQLYPLFSSTRMKKLWLLNDLFVSENQRGKGISVALINACKQHCITTEACGLLLETAKTNTIGNNLYPKTGFELDEDHNYYSWDC